VNGSPEVLFITRPDEHRTDCEEGSTNLLGAFSCFSVVINDIVLKLAPFWCLYSFLWCFRF